MASFAPSCHHIPSTWLWGTHLSACCYTDTAVKTTLNFTLCRRFTVADNRSLSAKNACMYYDGVYRQRRSALSLQAAPMASFAPSCHHIPSTWLWGTHLSVCYYTDTPVMTTTSTGFYHTTALLLSPTYIAQPLTMAFALRTMYACNVNPSTLTTPLSIVFTYTSGGSWGLKSPYLLCLALGYPSVGLLLH